MPDFSKPGQWLAEWLDNTNLGETRSRPVLIGCRPTNSKGAPALHVVKALGLPDVDAFTALRETFGTILARSLGVRVHEPAIVDIDSAFVSANEHMPALLDRSLKLLPGVVFGSRYTRMIAPMSDTRYDTPDLIDSAVRIYGFDLSFQNADRLPTNPNCGLHQGQLFAFDFARAFEFTGWRTGNEDIPACSPSRHWVARRHLLYPVASAHRDVLDAFAMDVAALDLDALERETLGWMPPQWHLGAKLIHRHIRTIQADFSAYRNSLLGAAA